MADNITPDEEYQNKVRKIQGNLASDYDKIGSNLFDKSDIFSQKLSGYIFLAHAAILTLILSEVTVATKIAPVIYLKICFMASSFSLIALSVEMMVGANILRLAGEKFYEGASLIRNAALETPPRIIDDPVPDDFDFKGSIAKFSWLAVFAVLILSLELLSSVFFVWFV
jgi:hypothetical protein